MANKWVWSPAIEFKCETRFDKNEIVPDDDYVQKFNIFLGSGAHAIYVFHVIHAHIIGYENSTN